MKIARLHPWNVSYTEAVRIQDRLRLQIRIRNFTGKVDYVAGADVSCSRKSADAWAGIVVMEYPGLKVVEQAWARGRPGFPYIPGLLGFREIPLLIEAFKNLETGPELVLCDGQGIAHPRGMGLASHLGLIIETPTIGCAKKRLVGEYGQLGPERGDSTPLFWKGHRIGAVVRTRNGIRPLFVSPGHDITVSQAVRMVLDCGAGYRIPEPVRQAHLLVNRLRRMEEVS